MGKASIDKLIGMLTGEGRPRFPRRTAAADLAVGRVERDGLSSLQDFMDVCTCCCAHLIQGADGRGPQQKELAESTVRRILASGNSGARTGRSIFPLRSGTVCRHLRPQRRPDPCHAAP